MSKMRSRRPANDTRRRSLVELTAAASHAVDHELVATSADASSAPQPVAAPEAANAAAVPSAQLANSDSAAAMVVKIAKVYQETVLENVRVGLNVALDRAKDYAETKRASNAGSDGARDGGHDSVVAGLGGAAAEFRAETLELMRANMASGLQCARDLVAAKTAAEWVELSGSHARKQCELMLKQADALKSFAWTLTKARGE